MKKFFYSILLLAVAGMATTAFVSCEEDDVVEEKQDAKEDYLCIKYWVSNDLLDIADVTTTGIGALKFNTNATYSNCAGKECDLVELSGKQASEAAFTVKLTLKSNWQELLSKKETIECYESYGIGKTKGQDIVGLSASMSGATFGRDMLGDKYESTVSSYIERMGFEY